MLFGEREVIMRRIESKRNGLKAAPALAAFLVLSGASVFACSLSDDVDAVLQPENGAATGSSTSGASSSGSASGSSSGGGGASSTSGSSSGMGSGGGLGTGGNMTGPENCSDGNDNDGDGAVDCADSDCQPGFECVDAAPAGWAGPMRVDTAAFPSPAPAMCDNGQAPENYFAGPAGDAQCSACTCGDVMGASCSPAQMTCWSGVTNCMVAIGNGTDWTPSLQNAACNKPTNLLGFTGTLSCLISTPGQVLTKGSCTPSASDFPNKETWQSQVSACDIPEAGGGCGNGQVCIPKAVNPTPTESVCIKQDGASKACPAGYANVIDAFTDGTDTRGCSACACGDSNLNCAGGYTFNDLDNCAAGGNDQPIPVNSNQCKNVTALLENSVNSTWSVSTINPVANASCPASGGQPTGSVNTQGPVTFCCK